jgi:hypothetical protein
MPLRNFSGLMNFRFFKPILKMPDGSEHEMRIEGSFPHYTGNNQFLSNYYKYQSTGAVPFTSTARLYTVDGTFVAATYEPSGSYKIHLKDGTVVESATGGQRIKDPNGNSILLTGSSAKDEHTGREIKWSAVTYNSQPATKVEYQSVGGAWQSVWVVWGTTTVQGKTYPVSDWDMGNEMVCQRTDLIYTQMEVVREIVLPQTEPGQTRKFAFSYNSDSTESTTTWVNWSCYSGWQEYTRAASIGWGARA